MLTPVVTGNRSLDITHLDSTMPTSWFVTEGADLKLLNSQYEAIKAGGTAGTDYNCTRTYLGITVALLKPLRAPQPVILFTVTPVPIQLMARAATIPYLATRALTPSC